jgi:hypothetical protein
MPSDRLGIKRGGSDAIGGNGERSSVGCVGVFWAS